MIRLKRRKRLKKIKNFLEDKIQAQVALSDKNWGLAAKFFSLIDKNVKHIRNPFIKPVIKKIIKMENPTQLTQGVVAPISQDLNFIKSAQNVVLPIDLVRKAIEESSYRVVMNKCICRTSRTCSDYPIDMGCIFLGTGARVLVKNRAAREATVQEALEHLDKAAQLGMVCQCLWVEAERFGLGMNRDEHKKFFEICLCCPCCCLGFRNFIHMPPEIMERFRVMEWQPKSNDDCNLCGLCERNCPVGAISLESGGIYVNRKCLGCGLCAANCPQKALSMDQVREPKQGILDYIEGLDLEL